MPKPYSMIFIGQPTSKGTLLLQDSVNCYQQVTIALHTYLSHLPHIDYSFVSSRYVDRGAFYDSLRRADGIAFFGLPNVWQSYDRERLRRITNCRAVITICSGPPSLDDCDWRFVLVGEGSATTRTEAPVWRAIYRQCAKRRKTVLIDHWSQDTATDWTQNIERWLECLSSEFSISRYIQTENEPEDVKILPYLTQIHRMPFQRWLDATDQLETFVVTHYESYGYAILDMFARGIRVLCPSAFVPPHFAGRFHIDTFDNGDDLVRQLRTSPDPALLAQNQAALTDWADVAKLIDERFQSLFCSAAEIS